MEEFPKLYQEQIYDEYYFDVPDLNWRPVPKPKNIYGSSFTIALSQTLSCLKHTSTGNVVGIPVKEWEGLSPSQIVNKITHMGFYYRHGFKPAKCFDIVNNVIKVTPNGHGELNASLTVSPIIMELNDGDYAVLLSAKNLNHLKVLTNDYEVKECDSNTLSKMTTGNMFIIDIGIGQMDDIRVRNITPEPKKSFLGKLKQKIGL